MVQPDPQFSDARMTDAQLLKRYVDLRDAHAFELLVRRHGAMVLGICRRYVDAHEAEDAMQAVFVALSQKAAALKVDHSLSGWLFKVARHTSMNLARGRRRAVHREQKVGNMKSLTEQQQPQDALLKSEMGNYLDEAIMSLGEKDREVVLMHDVQGMTHREIAEMTGSPEGTISSRLTRAREKLRQKLLRRGAVGASVVMPTLLAAEYAEAALPETLVQSTTQAAGNSAALTAAMSAAAVSTGGMMLAWKWVAIVCMGLLAGAGGVGAYMSWGMNIQPEVAAVEPGTIDLLQRPNSQQNLAILGPFNWYRSLNLGEDARLEDAREGAFLGTSSKQMTTEDPSILKMWSYQFNMKFGEKGVIHASNSFLNRDQQVAYETRVDHLKINTSGDHNFRLSLAYVPEDARMWHGQGEDLLAKQDFDRVLLVVPMRHRKVNNYKPGITPVFVFASGDVDFVSVIQIPAGESMDFAMFHKKNHPNMLYDLRPFFQGEVNVNDTQPMFDFQLLAGGGWRLKVEYEGKDRLEGGTNPTGWDLVLSHRSEGAKGHDMKLKPETSRWGMGTFSPGGSPADSSELWLTMKAYERSTGESVVLEDTHLRITDTTESKASAILEEISN